MIVPNVAKKRLTVLQATFIGVGSTTGAGIFALLGAAGAVAGSAVWLSFLIAGSSVVAAGYPSWAKALGVLFIPVMTGLNAIGSTADLSKAGGREEAPSELWLDSTMPE